MGRDEVREELIHTAEATDVTGEEDVNDLSEDNEWQGGERDCDSTLVLRGDTQGRIGSGTCRG